MLSYRHAFHAGNHGDVLKHALLARALAYLVAKDRPLLYLDTHAGAGLYDLGGASARRTGEAARGAGQLWREESPPALLRPWLAALRALNPGAHLRRYPGSPLLVQRALRPTDRALCYELHPSDQSLLAAALAGDPRFRALREDGLGALRAQLPPRERRALVLLDPSYELDRDYRTVPAALAGALRRFGSGVYLLWYPLLGGTPARRLIKSVVALGVPRVLRVELELMGARPGPGMTGSGVLLVNPPWVLEAELHEALPWIASRLGDSGADWRLEWLSG
jgi:23S rRNA (adenine2030-N6)-methyltransferase